ncbi:hypothetical protein Cpap_2214 [Ruminiclostridium papyrosolvens DSM 2782]|uniref:Uncharacterized protein n=1 Tax=Ruminiclostridium papyrosolvens DSM 2782 TaxID=588581 RepID=F1TCU4_9FIRM|nr:hypothetical protein [Ruminiclostridium papyrosolvens]EGD47811.1 hypothetical protein Cpap_2214 [Ruminiclostridium papyrosolvens DSM 2782]WES34527.1 hypothetical protein P0092_00685 [Ruminiclostridium papyrosolvens DSM 2782]
MVKKNEYPRKNYVRDDGQAGQQTTQPAPQQKTYQKDGETRHKESHVRSTRPPRDQQKEGYQPRENNPQKKEFTPRENNNNQRDNANRESAASRDTQHRENNHQRNYHRENFQGRDNREPYKQHYQRPAIKPRAEETVEDIANDIVRIQKEIDLELKEIRSMRLGV